MNKRSQIKIVQEVQYIVKILELQWTFMEHLCSEFIRVKFFKVWFVSVQLWFKDFWMSGWTQTNSSAQSSFQTSFDSQFIVLAKFTQTLFSKPLSFK